MKPATSQTVPANRDGASCGNAAIWIALIVGCGVCLSTVFACVTPFAALATLATLKLGWRRGLLVVGLIWLANQAIGYGMLGYPWTWDSLAWGASIGLAAALAVTGATTFASARPVPLVISLPFVAAFTAFELTLYTAGFILPGGDAAFSAAIISHIFLINVTTLCVLIILYYLTILAGLQTRLYSLAPAAAASSR